MEYYQKQLQESNEAIKPLGVTIEVSLNIFDDSLYDVGFDECNYYTPFMDNVHNKDLCRVIRKAQARIINNAKNKVIDTFDRLGETHQIDLLCTLYNGLTDAQKDKFLRDTGNP